MTFSKILQNEKRITRIKWNEKQRMEILKKKKNLISYEEIFFIEKHF